MNFYEVLGVGTDADPPEIRRAYRDRARRFHPDVNEHPESRAQFRVLTRARDVLTDPEERDAYDRLGHGDYVVKRIDGKFPAPEMVPQPKDGSGLAGGVEGTVSPRRSTGRGRHGAEPSTGRSVTDGAPSDGAPSDGAPSDGVATDGAERPRPGEEDPSTAGSRAADTNRRSTGRAGSTVTTSSGPSGGEAASDRSGPRTKSHSVPPTPGAAGTSGRAPTSGRTRTSGRSRTAGRSRASGQSSPRGPQRISGTPASEAWNQQPIGTVVLDHLAASTRWIGVVVAAGAYFAGLAGYLGAHRAGVDALAAALTSSDPVVVAGALRDQRYGVPSVTSYSGTVDLLAGGVLSDATLLLAGVVLLPVALALAVGALRRATTWRPTWLYVFGALGPAVAVALPIVVSHSPESAPIAAVPLLVDLLLLVVFPGVVVASFLLNRLLVVLPLRRREHLVAS